MKQYESRPQLNWSVETLSTSLRKPQWIIWLLAAPAGLLPFLHGALDYFLGFFPSMLVHELGHMTSGWLAGVPSISFFFAAFSYLSAQSIAILLLFVVCELVLAWYALQKNYYSVLLVLAAALVAHTYFIVDPAQADWFIVFGGMGGELVLPLGLCLLSNDFQILRRGKLLLLHAVCYLAFWHSLYEWLAAAAGLRPIPYPPDSAGGPALFQNPFATGVPVGDLDKLIELHGWTEKSLIATYTIIALLSLCGFVWALLLTAMQTTTEKNPPA